MNFKHLYYFWATAKAGGVMRAGEQLHVTPQTLSGQIKLLEGRLGCALFAKSGRRLELTSAGRTALRYADQIFALGEELEAAMSEASGDGDRLDFRVGVSDSVPKAIAYRLLEPALDVERHVRLICHEGQFDDLLGRLAVHKLDLVLADEPMRREMSVRAFNHTLGASALTFFATPALKASLPRAFPANLSRAPMLLPTYAGIRGRFERWCSVEGLHVNIVAELDDSALITRLRPRGTRRFHGADGARARARMRRSRRSSATRSRRSAFPRAAVNVIPFTERDAVRALVQQSELVDLAIPRGGEALIRFVTENARVPVVQHYKGVCHMFLDAGADLALSERSSYSTRR